MTYEQLPTDIPENDVTHRLVGHPNLHELSGIITQDEHGVQTA